MQDLRILFIEDFENDVILLLRELQKGGYNVQWERVETAGDLEAALTRQPWDLIICDYSIPRMNVQVALEIMQQSELDLPFIIVSGSIEEEAAVSALKAGAHDFIIKNNLARFLPAITRELKEAENRRELKRADDNLRASEMRFRSTFESMVEGCQIIGYDWRYLYVNDSAAKHSQRTKEQMLGHTVMECYPGIESTALFATLKRCMNQRSSSHMLNEFSYPNSEKSWFQLSIQPSPDGIFILSIDVTNHKLAERALIEREMKLATLFEILPIGISILDENRQLSYTNPALKNILDITEEGVLTGAYKNRRYLKGDGSPMELVEQASARVLLEKKEISEVETGVVKENGELVWTSVSAVPVDFPDWKIVIVTSDITKHKQAETEILELNTELERKVAERTAELAAANEQLHQLSLFDVLTGLYNRRGFLLVAEEQLSLARRAKRNLIVFYADLDGLKQINDELGHATGDEAIAKAAHSLSETFRNTDIKARLGGDEFIVMAIEADGDNVESMLQRLREKLAENDQSMSVGVVKYNSEDELLIEDLVAEADRAMYVEKRKRPHR
jgi:diguanylate cyclase (GGDEF)-like protein/PAS domain S-box-containing protein